MKKIHLHDSVFEIVKAVKDEITQQRQGKRVTYSETVMEICRRAGVRE